MTSRNIIQQETRLFLTNETRTSNFSATEKHLLLSIISQHKSITENKKTDMVSVEEKNKAWEIVCVHFNASCPDERHRSVATLEKLYNSKKN